MKQHPKWFAGAFAAASVLLMASAAQAQVVLSDFDNFNLTVTYGNWNPDGSQPINGGSGYTPTLTSGPTSYGVNAQGYGSGGYSIPLGSQQLLSTDIAQATLSLTLNSPNHTDAWMGIKFLLSDNQGNNDVFYGTYVGVFGVDNGAWANGSVGTASWSGNTLTMTVPLTGAMLAGVQTGTSQITGFGLLFDPAFYAPGGNFPAYDITYNSLTLSAVPEPSTFALFGLGSAGLLIFRRRRN